MGWVTSTPTSRTTGDLETAPKSSVNANTVHSAAMDARPCFLGFRAGRKGCRGMEETVAHSSALVLPRLAAVGYRSIPVGTNNLVRPGSRQARQAAHLTFEPRSRGFSESLLGQPFYGWCNGTDGMPGRFSGLSTMASAMPIPCRGNVHWKMNLPTNFSPNPEDKR